MNADRIKQIVDDTRKAIAPLETEHLCDDVMIAKEYCAIQYALSRISEVADATD
ncbi:hypothetical protein LCGC14_2627020 [marine sediment metagenome]|uniref:Uncharacterized protein n=1 Tax=marine sediment metagenome TaxID=412755 RepID=A0A0F9CTY3_9ZZZZ